MADPVYQFALHTDKQTLGTLKERPRQDETSALQDYVALGADGRSHPARSSSSSSSANSQGHSADDQTQSKSQASHFDQEATSARKSSKAVTAAATPAKDGARLSDQEALLAFASLQGSQTRS